MEPPKLKKENLMWWRIWLIRCINEARDNSLEEPTTLELIEQRMKVLRRKSNGNGKLSRALGRSYSQRNTRHESKRRKVGRAMGV
jgi:hypothetical protein